MSGKEYVEVEGQIDLSAANGQKGEFLIDPLNVMIVPGTVNQGSMSGGIWSPSFQVDYSRLGINRLEHYLGIGNVTITTFTPFEGERIDGGRQSGWVEFNAGRDVRTLLENNSSLRINAADYIRFYTGIDFRGSGNVTLNAGSFIDIQAPINLRGGGRFTKK